MGKYILYAHTELTCMNKASSSRPAGSRCHQQLFQTLQERG